MLCPPCLHSCAVNTPQVMQEEAKFVVPTLSCTPVLEKAQRLPCPSRQRALTACAEHPTDSASRGLRALSQHDQEVSVPAATALLKGLVLTSAFGCLLLEALASLHYLPWRQINALHIAHLQPARVQPLGCRRSGYLSVLQLVSTGGCKPPRQLPWASQQPPHLLCAAR